MPSYIFSFKHNALSLIIVFFVTALASNILLNHIATIPLEEHIPSDEFGETDISSKIRHFNALTNRNRLEYIFIGSSKTLYGISTNILKDAGIESYNFGLSGAELLNYPDILNPVLPSHPKYIVLNISANKLINSHAIGPFQNNGWYSLRYAINTWDPSLIYNTFIGFARNQNVFEHRGKEIRDLVTQIYNSFDPTSLGKSTESLHTSDLFGKKYIDCKIFDYPYERQGIALCSNGDGLLFYVHRYIDKKIPLPTKQSFNNLYIDYLNQILSSISANNITPIIIFEPTTVKYSNVNMDLLRKKIKSEYIIDLTNFPVPNDGWADESHLNVKGRKLYSIEIANRLKTLNEKRAIQGN